MITVRSFNIENRIANHKNPPPPGGRGSGAPVPIGSVLQFPYI